MSCRDAASSGGQVRARVISIACHTRQSFCLLSHLTMKMSSYTGLPNLSSHILHSYAHTYAYRNINN